MKHPLNDVSIKNIKNIINSLQTLKNENSSTQEKKQAKKEILSDIGFAFGRNAHLGLLGAAVVVPFFMEKQGSASEYVQAMYNDFSTSIPATIAICSLVTAKAYTVIADSNGVRRSQKMRKKSEEALLSSLSGFKKDNFPEEYKEFDKQLATLVGFNHCYDKTASGKFYAFLYKAQKTVKEALKCSKEKLWSKMETAAEKTILKWLGKGSLLKNNNEENIENKEAEAINEINDISIEIDEDFDYLKWVEEKHFEFPDSDFGKYLKSEPETRLGWEAEKVLIRCLDKTFSGAYEKLLQGSIKKKSVEIFNDYFEKQYNGSFVLGERDKYLEKIKEISELYNVTKEDKYKSLSEFAEAVLNIKPQEKVPYLSLWAKAEKEETKHKVILDHVDNRSFDMGIPRIINLENQATPSRIMKEEFDMIVKREVSRMEHDKSFQAESSFEEIDFSMTELASLKKGTAKSKYSEKSKFRNT